MIALFNFLPHHCPQCGKALEWNDCRDERGRLIVRGDADFFAGASHSCDCGLSYQYAEAPHLLEAATKQGGDLARYVKE